MSVRWIRVDDTTHPVDIQTDDEDATQWRLVYGAPTREDLLAASSVMSAYASLITPGRTTRDAIGILRRARRAAQLGETDQ